MAVGSRLVVDLCLYVNSDVRIRAISLLCRTFEGLIDDFFAYYGLLVLLWIIVLFNTGSRHPLNMILQLIYQIIIPEVLFLVYRTDELEMSLLESKVNDFSPDDHDQDEVLKNVQEIIFSHRVVLGQTYLSKVRHLFQVVVLKGHVPTQWLPKLYQEPRILIYLNKTRSLYEKSIIQKILLHLYRTSSTPA